MPPLGRRREHERRGAVSRRRRRGDDGVAPERRGRPERVVLGEDHQHRHPDLRQQRRGARAHVVRIGAAAAVPHHRRDQRVVDAADRGRAHRRVNVHRLLSVVAACLLGGLHATSPRHLRRRRSRRRRLWSRRSVGAAAASALVRPMLQHAPDRRHDDAAVAERAEPRRRQPPVDGDVVERRRHRRGARERAAGALLGDKLGEDRAAERVADREHRRVGVAAARVRHDAAQVLRVAGRVQEARDQRVAAEPARVVARHAHARLTQLRGETPDVARVAGARETRHDQADGARRLIDSRVEPVDRDEALWDGGRATRVPWRRGDDLGQHELLALKRRGVLWRRTGLGERALRHTKGQQRRWPVTTLKRRQLGEQRLQRPRRHHCGSSRSSTAASDDAGRGSRSGRC